MASTLLMNSYFIPAERECSIDIISFLMYGTSDDARPLQQYRQFFIRAENYHHKKFLIEWWINSLANADELIIALINLRMYVNQEEYYTMLGSWSKLLAKFCKRDQIPLPTKISEDRTKLILNGLIWVRKQSKSITINTLNYRVIYWFWERSRFKNTRICTIDRNDIYMAHFISGGKIEKDMDDFSTIRFKLKLIDEHITALVLCMDHLDVMDMLDSGL